MIAKKNKLQRKIFYISGMHCTSCKGIIKDRIQEQEDVQSVEVDLKNETVEVAFKGKKLEAEKITKKFEDVGYLFSDQPFKKKIYKKVLLVLFVALIVSFLLVQSEKFMLFSETRIDENSSIIAFIILGVVASLSSCIALVGGILLSMTRNWTKTISKGKEVPLSKKMEPHMKFHIGRLGAYFIGGGILGSIGNLTTFDNPSVYAVLTVIVAIIMLLIGLQMLGVRWVLRMYVFIYTNTLKKIHINDNIKNKSPFITGAATFFIPCGFTLIAQGVALTSGNFISGAVIMTAFAIGTLPILLGVSLGGATIIGKKGFEVIFNTIIGTIIIIFAIYILNGQFNVLGLPSLNDISFKKTGTIEQIKDNKTSKKNTQELNIVADGFKYVVVGSKTLRAGVPTTIIVDNQGIAGCGVFMAARGLFEGILELKLGINKKEFIPKAGTYKLTCTMGMVAPVTIIVK